MKQLLELFISFFKVGAMTFGGGYAMLPILEREVTVNKKWISTEEIMDYYAIGQCTPGLIAVNTSTFVGNKLAGPAGGVIATLGFLTPGFLVILLVAVLLNNVMDYEVVHHAFAGVRVCVFVLIVNTCIKMGKSSIDGLFTFGIFAVVLAATVFFSVPPALLVILAGILGVLQGLRRPAPESGEKQDDDPGKGGLS
ncbi:MAG: chromate transporter [Firmicutes bacterium]|nr:chromate transporter [Bacillota bacterium]